MWVYIPGTSSHSAQASADSISESDWRVQGLARSATWRGKSPAAKSLQRGCRKHPLISRLFGRMPEPSMADRGVALWMESLAESLVSPTHSRALAGEVTTNAIYGMTSRECFLNVRLLGLSSRTSTAFSCRPNRKGSPPPLYGFFKSFPKSGGMRNGLLFERPMLEPLINAAACSSLHESGTWPTSQATDGEKMSHPRREGDRTLSSTTTTWTTPKAMTGGANSNRAARRAGGPCLQEQTQHWQTPRTVAGGYTRDQGNPDKERLSLIGQARAWPTPNSRDVKGSGPAHTKGGRDLSKDAENWPTPNSNEDKYRLQGSSQQSKGLTATVIRRSSQPAPMTPDGQKSSKPSRRLNPLFVEWLMGWPVGWTELEPVEMASYLYKLRSHYEYLLQGLNKA